MANESPCSGRESSWLGHFSRCFLSQLLDHTFLESAVQRNVRVLCCNTTVGPALGSAYQKVVEVNIEGGAKAAATVARFYLVQHCSGLLLFEVVLFADNELVRDGCCDPTERRG